MLHHNGLLSSRQLAFVLASAQAEHHETMKFEYRKWSHAKEARVRMIKAQCLKHPVDNPQKRKRMKPKMYQGAQASEGAVPQL